MASDLATDFLALAHQFHRLGVLGQADTAYQQALAADPGRIDALHGLAVLRLAVNDATAALALLTKAVAQAPQRCDVALDLALAFETAGRADMALRVYRRVLTCDPTLTIAWYNSALLLAAGAAPTALAAYRRATQVEPTLAAAHFNFGNLASRLGRDARVAYRNALVLRPAHGPTWTNWAVTAREPGPAARRARYRALCCDPTAADAWFDLANVRDDPVPALHQALSLAPAHAGAWVNLGTARHRQGDVVGGIVAWRRALNVDVEAVQAWRNLGAVGGSAAAAANAAVLDPGGADPWCVLGNGARDADQPLVAANRYRRALVIDPDHAESLVNLATVLPEIAEPDAIDRALAACRRAIRLNPEDGPAHYNLSLLQLRRGELAAGFAEYEWGWRVGLPGGRGVVRRLEAPLWQGEALRGRTLLVYAEQGLGDTLQFVRYVPLLVARGARVVLEVQKELVRLLDQSLGGATVQVVPLAANYPGGAGLPPVDAHCPLLSLPFRLGTSLDTIPADVPYLAADAAAVQAWRRLHPADGRMRVGLVWAGNPRLQQRAAHAIDRRRSLRLEQLASWAGIPGIEWVSLQKGAAAGQGGNGWDVGGVLADWGATFHDFADTAVALSTLDLLISVDTSVVHLAGALAVPVWILSRFDGCWRWLEDRDDSPWYPSARLFRQPAPGDWTPVIARIGEALGRLILKSQGAVEPDQPDPER
ncbi:MAG: tetratricopeptide repeat protein [Azospirillaceae bacterium]|nr:tetratricopeptide repeat protein [Azospirillaceae bacterium]